MSSNSEIPHSKALPMENIQFDYDFFWDKYKTLIVVGVVVVIGVVVSLGFWKVQGDNRTREAQDFLTGISETKDLPTVFAKYPGTPAAAQALLLYGDAQYQAQKWDGAIKAYSDFIRSFSKHELMPVALMGLAASQEAKGDVEGAMFSYRKVFQEYSDSHRAAEARIALGQLYESKGNIPLARQMYESVNASNPQSIWRTTANEKLQALAAKK